MFSDDYRDRGFYTNWPNWSDNQVSFTFHLIFCGFIGIFGAPFNSWGLRLALGLKTFKHLMTKINMIQLVKQQEALWTFIKIPFKARKCTPSRVEILRWNKNNKKYFASLEEKLPWHLKSRLVCFPSKH